MERRGGYGLYLRDGVPTFVYNFFGLERPTFSGSGTACIGPHKLVVDFVYDGDRIGKGIGTVTLSENGATIAEASRARFRQDLAYRRAGHWDGHRLAGRFHVRPSVRVTGSIEAVHIDLSQRTNSLSPSAR
ncbi:MAG: hypothetical protein R2843_11245 [Thermomicrobiales bacterium]